MVMLARFTAAYETILDAFIVMHVRKKGIDFTLYVLWILMLRTT